MRPAWIIKLFLATVLPLLPLYSTELGYSVKIEKLQYRGTCFPGDIPVG